MSLGADVMPVRPERLSVCTARLQLEQLTQVPHMEADELATGLGVVKSTMANKAARIRKVLDLSWFES